MREAHGKKKPRSSVTGGMTTAAKRARKKANRAQEQVPVIYDEVTSVVKESEHAAAMMALAAAKRFKRKVKDD